MRRVNIINPVAGQGDAEKYVDKTVEAENYITSFAGDACRHVRIECSEDPQRHYYVYGGDGTLNEVVNGVMKSGNTETPVITPMATGTGNDFIRTCRSRGLFRSDVIKYNDNYALNLINIGFDSNCAKRASEYKKLPLISGSAAYVFGVARTLIGRLGEFLSINYTDENGIEYETEGQYLLCVIGNGQYYGGGFRATPLASLRDGLLDMLIVDKMSRRRFISLVGTYKKGLHLTKDGAVIDKFKDIMKFIRCRRIEIKNAKNICVDGEILTDETNLNISVVRNAINIEA